jgi:hypothetical protein
VEFYLLLALVIISVLLAIYTAFMVFGIRDAVDAVDDLADFCERVFAEEEVKPLRPRVSIARDREMPDALEAVMERRAQRIPRDYPDAL